MSRRAGQMRGIFRTLPGHPRYPLFICENCLDDDGRVRRANRKHAKCCICGINTENTYCINTYEGFKGELWGGALRGEHIDRRCWEEPQPK